MTILRTITAVALAGLAVAGHAEAASAKADLSVSRGTVAVSGGQLTGTFTVRNAGPSRVRSTSASIKLRSSARVVSAGRFTVKGLSRRSAATVRVRVRIPSVVRAGTYKAQACADSGALVRERSERNNCRTVGTVVVGPDASPKPAPSPSPSPAPAPLPPGPKPTPTPIPGSDEGAPLSAPITVKPDEVQELRSSKSEYWLSVPQSYDAAHTRPATLFVWMHGCGGEGRYDIYDITPAADRPYVAIAVGGAEKGCWDMTDGMAKVFAAIGKVRTHLNIDPARIYLGGYSSGGDLSYHMALKQPALFAGILVENTSPFRDSGATLADAQAASKKVPVAHLAHRQDDTYPIAGVRSELAQLKSAGYLVKDIERDGTHYDADGGGKGTVYDLQTDLLPLLRTGI